MEWVEWHGQLPLDIHQCESWILEQLDDLEWSTWPWIRWIAKMCCSQEHRMDWWKMWWPWDLVEYQSPTLWAHSLGLVLPCAWNLHHNGWRKGSSRYELMILYMLNPKHRPVTVFDEVELDFFFPVSTVSAIWDTHVRDIGVGYLLLHLLKPKTEGDKCFETHRHKYALRWRAVLWGIVYCFTLPTT